MDSRRAGQMVRIMVAGSFALTLAACGSGSGGSGGAGEGSGTPSGPGSSSSTPSTPNPAAAFPITVTRKGGIAGFNDTLVLQADGSLQISSRGHESTCQVKPEILKEILRAVGGVPWSRLAPSSGKARYPDDMVAARQERRQQGTGAAGRPRPGAAEAAAERPGGRLLGPDAGARAVRPDLTAAAPLPAHDDSADPAGPALSWCLPPSAGPSQPAVTEVSSTTKLVCSEASSFIRYFSVMVLPLYAESENDFCA